MHPSYNNYYSKAHHVPPPNSFQQSGHPIYCIGAYAYPVISTNMFMSQPQFQRTFASVVCENPNFDPSTNHHLKVENETQTQAAAADNSGLFNSFIKRLTKQPPPPPPQVPIATPHSYQNYPHKEFEDFTKIPTVINNNNNSHPANSSSASTNHHHSVPFPGNFEMPFMNQQAYYQPPPSHSQKHYQQQQQQQPRNNFFSTIMGTWYPQNPHHQQHPQQQQQHFQPNNNNQQRWFSRGFRGFRCNKNNKQQQQQGRPHSRHFNHDASNTKNVHEKERNSIERDIKNDFCDISGNKSKFVDKNQLRNQSETAKSNNNNNKNCDKSEENPPFEIFSLDEFPAIVSPASAPLASLNNSNGDHELDEHDFVSYKDDAAATTPSYTPMWPPKRISLCEKVSKIVKSPQKLLALPTLATPRRSCLKPTQRNRSMSECSDGDDFIVFAYSCGENKNQKDDESDSEEDDSDGDSEEDSDESEMSDDDDTIVEGDEVDEVDDAKWQDEDMQQPDSGIETGFAEKKVSKHFKMSKVIF